MGKGLHAKSITIADVDAARVLYDIKSTIISKIEYLEARRLDLAQRDVVSELIEADEAMLRDVDVKLRELGMPSDTAELQDYYGSVAKALQTLSTAQEVTGWIKGNFPDRHQRKLAIFDSVTNVLKPELTGKWNGTWKSHYGFIGGNIALAICQIGYFVVGSGALSNSLYSKGYVEGAFDAGTLTLELFSDEIPDICKVEAAIPGGGDYSAVRGTYSIGRFDMGEFMIRKLPFPVEAHADRPIKVLAIFANPRGADTLRLGTEDRVLRECIRLSRNRDLIKLDVRHAAQIHDVRRALLDDSYDIVHFSGHGTAAGLVLENESGDARLVPPAALAELVSAYSPPIQCVLLNACYTTSQGGLLAGSVPYVISMDQAVSDEGAIEFTRGFYDAIGAGKDTAFAFQEGCRTIRLVGLPDGATPSLFQRQMP
jgi:hypothetical protein